MTSPQHTRLELLAALSKLSRLRPEWRLGQTLANLAMTAGQLDAGGVWDLEDKDALRAAQSLIEEYSATQSELLRAEKSQKKQGHSRLPSRTKR